MSTASSESALSGDLVGIGQLQGLANSLGRQHLETDSKGHPRWFIHDPKMVLNPFWNIVCKMLSRYQSVCVDCGELDE